MEGNTTYASYSELNYAKQRHVHFVESKCKHACTRSTFSARQCAVHMACAARAPELEEWQGCPHF
jgi:hypothetical protein